MAVKDFAWMDRGEMTERVQQSEGTTSQSFISTCYKGAKSFCLKYTHNSYPRSLQ
jgi:hypothetical protein